MAELSTTYSGNATPDNIDTGDITSDSITVGAGSAADPSVAVGANGHGIYEVNAATLGISVAGVNKLSVGSTRIWTTGAGLLAGGGSSSATTPGLFLSTADLNTGIGRAGDDQLSLISGGVEAMRYEENGGVLALSQITAGITAHTGSSQGDGPITSSINQYSTVANAGDAATMPTAVAGYLVEIYNDGVNAMDVFPASGDDLGAGADTAVSLAAGDNITYRSIDATNWKVRT